MGFTIHDLRLRSVVAIVGAIVAVSVGLFTGVERTFAAPATMNEPADLPDVMIEPNDATPPVIRPDIGTENGVVPEELWRHVVRYDTREPAGTIVIDTPNTFLYYVLGNGQAIRYGIGVGREGFTWSGVRAIDRKVEWPDWIPPVEMIERQPELPRWMAGGPSNPLGARAMYLAGTLYRIHGTSEPETIGKHVSSGCIRMLNEDVIDLYNRVPIGTKVVVLPDSGRRVSGEARRRPPAERIYGDAMSRDVPAVKVFSPLGLY